MRAMGSARAVKCAEENLPEGVYAQVLDASDYVRPLGDVRRSLSEAGKRVLDAAARMGYFETPREAALEDVVDEVGLARDSVADHLREISAKVLGPLGRDRP